MTSVCQHHICLLCPVTLAVYTFVGHTVVLYAKPKVKGTYGNTIDWYSGAHDKF